jgi:GTP-binding protein
MPHDQTTQPRFSPEQIEAGRLLFAGPCDFQKGVVALAGLPSDERVEVAFAGRSNVGKSSLLNALTGRKALARTSNTPGRTREINYFALGDTHYLVDMPGYGYARAEKRQVEAWNRLIRSYLRARASLRRVFVLIDARHGIKPNDTAIMTMLDEAAVSFQVVLTKADKLKAEALAALAQSVAQALRRHPAAHPEMHVTSSEKRTGIEELRAEIQALAGA